MTPALEQIKALPELPVEEWNGPNGRLYSAEQMREYALQALRDEAGEAVGQLAECFRLAGGDTECVSTPEGQARQAVEVVRDLRACYDEAIRPATAAEAAESEADELIRALGFDPERFRTEAGFINHYKLRAAILHPEDYEGLRAAEAAPQGGDSVCGGDGCPGCDACWDVGAVSETEEPVATPPSAPADVTTPDLDQCGHGVPVDPAKIDAYMEASAPAVDRDWYADEAGVIHVDWDHDPARQLSLMLKPDGKVGWAVCIGGEGCSGLDAMAPEFMNAIRRLSAPVPQEGVDEASFVIGYRMGCYGCGLAPDDLDERAKAAYQQTLSHRRALTALAAAPAQGVR